MCSILFKHTSDAKLNPAEPNFVEFTGLLHYTKKTQLPPPENQDGLSTAEDMDIQIPLTDQPPFQYRPGLDLVHFLPPMPARPPLLGRFPNKKALRASKLPDTITQTYQQIRRSERQAQNWRAYVDRHGVFLLNNSSNFTCLNQALATYTVKIRLEQLQNRADDAHSFAQAFLVAEELRKPEVPDHPNSGLWVDLDGAPLLAYFGLRQNEKGEDEFDGIPVSYIPQPIYQIAH